MDSTVEIDRHQIVGPSVDRAPCRVEIVLHPREDDLGAGRPYAEDMATSLRDETGWPTSVVRAVCAVPILVAVGVAVQRRDPASTALATIAALPWVLLALRVIVPWWATIALTLGATVGLLLQQPAPADPAPFFFVFTVAIFAVARPARQSLAVLLLWVGVMVAFQTAGRFADSAIWVLGITLGWLGGWAIRLQQSANAADAERAAAEERQRISRELHDVVAHSLAVTMLHVTGARLLLRQDPDAAEGALIQAEESGRQSMDDIRRAIGSADPPDHVPMPGAPDVRDLVDGFVAAGLPVTLHIDGDLSAVPAATGLALYRIVQESMSNVAKHAPAENASVHVCVDVESVRLSVRNRNAAPKGAGSSNGLGIVGMGERAALVGGALSAGPDDGEWSVVAELPIGWTP